ncbi:MAG: zinc ribbon domain-containing protein [Turicibacter sp.]|nr:zinc ribbon domain-containing protein [Turicibacter sp.]
MIGRGRGRNRGMSLGRVAKKAAVATVVSRAVNNAMDNRMGNNRGQGFGGQNMNQQPPQQPAMNTICPSCNAGNPQNAKFCLNCGSGFAPAENQQAQAAPQPTNCPGCRASLAGVNGNFCPYCRAAIG